MQGLSNESAETPKDKLRLIAELRQIGDNESVAKLLAFANDVDARVRFRSILALGGLKVVEALGILTHSLLHDKNDKVRLISATALGFFDSPLGLDELLTALNDSSELVVMNVIATLTCFNDDRASVAITALMNHDSWEIKLAACEYFIHTNSVDMLTINTLHLLNNTTESEERKVMINSVRENLRSIPEIMASGELTDPLFKTVDELIAEATQAYQSTKCVDK